MHPKAKALNKINNQLDKQISKDNQPLFTDMMVYLRGADISELHQEQVRQDVTQMILAAQERGESLDDLIGGDYKAFCDEVIASLPGKTTRQKVIDALDIAVTALAFLLPILTLMSKDFIAMIRDLFAGRPNDLRLPVTLGQVLAIGFILLASLLLVRLMTKRALSSRTTWSKVLLGLLIGFVFAGSFLMTIKLSHIVLFSLHVLIILGISLVLYASHKALERS
ncbi:MAG: hypothetical protein GXZ04_07925 [Clostridiales bacterium]|nr:hypothetical protein [Clostridiales bacterium]